MARGKREQATPRARASVGRREITSQILARDTRSSYNTATIINQRVNYGSVDESILASARTRNIHADSFPSREASYVEERRKEEEEGEKHGRERRETRPAGTLDGRGVANKGGTSREGEKQRLG